MKRYVLWMALVASSTLASSCVQHAPKPKTGADLVDDLGEQTLALDRFMAEDGVDEDGDQLWKTVDPDDVQDEPSARLMPYCGAVWVSANTMLTAFHCVEDEGETAQDRLLRMLLKQHRDPTGQLVYYSRRGEVNRERDRRFEAAHHARVYAIDPDDDLALVRTDPNTMDPQDDPHPIVRLASTPVRMGDELHIVGHVAQTWWTYTRGYVGADRPNFPRWDESSSMDVVQVNAPIWHGDSGSGAFNDRGELVGIASWIYTAAPSIGFYVATAPCRRFLARNDISP